MKKTLSALMAIVLVISAMAVQVFAEDSDLMPESLIPENEDELLTVLSGDEIEHKLRYNYSAEDVFFEMSVASLGNGNLLTTKKSGKYFYRSDIDSCLVVVANSFCPESSRLDVDSVKVGAAIYNSTTGVYTAKASVYVGVGDSVEELFDKTQLSATSAHYGFVKNLCGERIIQGRAWFANYNPC